MSVMEKDPKLKKAIIRKRNKRDLIIWEHNKAREEEHERIHDNEEKMRPQRTGDTPGEEVWSAKTQELRNRLTGKKRKANERWNRFAGTSGAGSRGK